MTESTTTEYRYLGQCSKAHGGCGQRLSLVLPEKKSVHWVTCPSCSNRAMLKRVEGEFNPDHKCDIRCTSARGHTCRCACGGANHGADWGMTALVAVDTPAAAIPKTGKHIGEVGKHIKGEVTVTERRALDKSVLYTFTTNGGDTIKWFVPTQYDPSFEVGDKFTIRAKVKAHEDHERFGKSTIVVYVERIQ